MTHTDIIKRYKDGLKADLKRLKDEAEVETDPNANEFFVLEILKIETKLDAVSEIFAEIAHAGLR